ncbi:MAG: hypothetical protein D4R64_07010 [Porphyromonadaceae bacterium]|nr:MAG: hypothetical protein D4R64_07010 [Porphyromonadaceae bacterium]
MITDTVRADNDYKFSKTLHIEDSLKSGSIEMTVSAKDPSFLLQYTAETLQLNFIASGQKPDTLNNKHPETTNDLPDPNCIFLIHDVKLPETCIGLSIIDNSRLKSTTEERYYAYYADGCRGGNVTKLNNVGEVDARIGVLWTDSSWFYENTAEATLLYTSSSITSYPGIFFKMRIRVSITGYAQYSYAFYYN